MNVKKYLNIYWERAIIAIKQSNEYKINFHMMNFFDIFDISTTLLFYYVLMNTLNDFLDWNLVDFIIYYLTGLLAWKILWFCNLRDFNNRLLKGELNQHILRPVNTYFLTTIQNFSGNNLISLIYIIPLTLALIIYNSYSITFYFIILIIFSWFYLITVFNMIHSFAFFIKNTNLIYFPFGNINSIITRFTPKLFNNFKFKDFIYLFPTAIYNYLIIELLKGNSNLLLNYFLLILFTFVLFIILTIILWYYGLKKYEGYN